MIDFNLEEYLNNGIENIVKDIMKASLKNPKASIFIMQHIIDSKTATQKRLKSESEMKHIPPFLIASITTKCNLHCHGCYARATKACIDKETPNILTCEDWNSIFSQAEELGIEFILLAGGEPFMRKDVLNIAAKHRKILFPIFTNGTMIDKSFLSVLDNNRNLLPVLSIEGNETTTDVRRGSGIYNTIQNTMKQLHKSGIIFGTSVTVTKQNFNEVFSNGFIGNLQSNGAKAIVYVEYVPMDEKSKDIALDDTDRNEMKHLLSQYRKKETGMLFISFPGDEKTSGGCLAAGRGFFHINAYGGAEPCPFSPYSDTNVMATSLEKAICSPLFTRLQQNGNLTQEHIGGCVLFEQKEQVEKILTDSLK